MICANAASKAVSRVSECRQYISKRAKDEEGGIE